MCSQLDDPTWYDAITEANEPPLCWCSKGYVGHTDDPTHSPIHPGTYRPFGSDTCWCGEAGEPHERGSIGCAQ